MRGLGPGVRGRFFVKVLVTGGAGFIGSAVVRQFIGDSDATVINLDKLTYAASLDAVAAAAGDPRYHFEKVDICDAPGVAEVFSRYRPDAVLHLAAESHVDRSIEGPGAFVQTNITGTYVMLAAALAHWNGLSGAAKARFRFHHVSTDEVYGSLGPDGFFTEETAYQPSSPYSASKASADHLARAWHRTFALPVVVTNCSNNYGPFQHPEKLIPLMIMNMKAGKPLPVYGDGRNVRDWLYVEDHTAAIWRIVESGVAGSTYNIGGENEWQNIELLHTLCERMAAITGQSAERYKKLITFVKDRPGHDRRYALNCDKIRNELGWTHGVNFEQGLDKTIRWYLNNEEWLNAVASGSYRDRYAKNYVNR